MYTDEKIVAYYAANARSKKELTAGIDEEVFHRLQQLLPKNLGGLTVLDAGCGDARWSHHLAELGAKKVIALDASYPMLALAQKRNKQAPVELIRADMRKLPLATESVDLAFASFSLMYFRPPCLRKVVGEISRVLRGGGRLYIATNLLWFARAVLARKHKDNIIPLELGAGATKSPTENAVQPPEAYPTAFKKAGLTLEHKEIFRPYGIAVAHDYSDRKRIKLAKAIYVAAKPALPKR